MSILFFYLGFSRLGREKLGAKRRRKGAKSCDDT